MLTLTPQYITENTDKKIFVVLPIHDFKAFMEELEEVEDMRLYDEGKKEDTGERIFFSDYVISRKSKNVTPDLFR